MRPFRIAFVALLSAALLAPATLAKPLPDRFTLGDYLPGDVWLYTHVAKNPERKWIEKEWQEVFDAFKATGIDRDVASLVTSLLDQDDREKAEETIDKWTALLGAVRWGDLCGREFAFAERLGIPPNVVDYLFLTRGAPDSAEHNIKALVAIAEELSKLDEKVALAHRNVDDVHIWTLSVKGMDAPTNAFSLIRKGDVIALVSGSVGVDDVVNLLTGKSEKPPITRSDRLREALSHVKPPEDTLSYFDLKMLLGDIERLISTLSQRAGGQDAQDAQKIAKIVSKLSEQLNVIDYTVTTTETDGRRELAHTVMRLQEGTHERALVCACVDRKLFDRFDRYIPADATGFSLSTSIDLEKLYVFVLDLIRDVVPDGEMHIEKWNATLAGFGFDPQRDLFSWWSGEMIKVSLPSAVVTPMSSGDGVFMIRVKDPQIASQKVFGAIDFLNERLKGEGQMLMVTPAPVEGGTFKQIAHPMLMMFIRPVVGVKDEWLIGGTSAAAIEKCLAVADGKAPSIMKNKRFQEEGLVPKGPVLSASFTDTSKFGSELGAAVGMVGMFGGMGTASIPDRPETKKLKSAIQRGLTIVTKLAPVLQKIDFYSSESSMTTYDGERTVRTEKVVTYKPPRDDGPKTAAAK